MNAANTSQRLREIAPALVDSVQMMPAAGLGTVHSDPEDPVPTQGDNRMLAELPDEVIDALIDASRIGSGSPLLLVEFRQLGGALARSAPDHGALDRLEGQFLAYTLGLPFNEQLAAQIEEAEGRVISALAPVANGSRYLNFADRPIDPRGGFSPDAYQRLARVRASYDPTGLFRANLQIPPSRRGV